MGKTPIQKTMTSIILEWKSPAGSSKLVLMHKLDFTWLATFTVVEQFLICP